MEHKVKREQSAISEPHHFSPQKILDAMATEELCIQMMMPLQQKLRSITNHGMKVRYYHDDIGVNSRLDTIQAAILRVKLKYLDRFNAGQKKLLLIFTMRLSSDALDKNS